MQLGSVILGLKTYGSAGWANVPVVMHLKGVGTFVLKPV